MKTTLNDAELDYCNAEGIKPADFLKRKLAAVKPESKKKAASKAARIGDAVKVGKDSFEFPNGLIVGESLARMIQKNSIEDLKQLRITFSLWASQLEKLESSI